MSRLLEALGWAVVHTAWIGLVLQLAWWLLVRSVHAADARYRLGGALLVGLGAAFSGLAFLFFAAKTGAVAPSAVPAGIATPLVSAAIPAMQPAAGPLAWPLLMRGVGLLWLAGAAAFLGRMIGGVLLVPRLYLRYTRPARPGWQAAVARLGAEIGVRAPRVLETAANGSPVVVGLLDPAVVLPTRGMEALGAAEFRSILAHELIHLRRRDHVTSLLQCLAEALFFFHPLVWRVSASLREEREKLCDAAASAFAPDPPTYVRGLLKLEQLRGHGAHALAARGGGALTARVRYLLEPHVRTDRASVASVSFALGTVCALGFAALLPPSLAAAARSAGPDVFTVQATDPAGPFSLTFRYGRLVSATAGGVRLPPSMFTQTADSVVFSHRHGARWFAVHVRPSGGIAWTPRHAPNP